MVPSITAKTPGWISFWIRSRSTSVSWITAWVQCRFRFRRPPKAFFIDPVVPVKTWVFTVGMWMTFLPIRSRGIWMPCFSNTRSSTSILDLGS